MFHISILMAVICLAFLAPILIVLMNSFKGKLFISTAPFDFPSSEAGTFVGLANYTEGVRLTGFFQAFGYSLFITVFSVFFIVLLTAMTGWFLARVENKVTRAIYLLLVFSMVVPFQMLRNLASVAGATDKDGLWGFIRRYAPEASPETHPGLDQAAGFAVRYFTDFVAPTRQFRAPTEQERAAMQDLAARLSAWDQPADAEALQSMVFAVGKDHGFDPLRDWFAALYQVLLGADQGPRFGGFIALYGIGETRALIEKALAGELATA